MIVERPAPAPKRIDRPNRPDARRADWARKRDEMTRSERNLLNMKHALAAAPVGLIDGESQGSKYERQSRQAFVRDRKWKKQVRHADLPSRLLDAVPKRRAVLHCWVGARATRNGWRSWPAWADPLMWTVPGKCSLVPTSAHGLPCTDFDDVVDRREGPR